MTSNVTRSAGATIRWSIATAVVLGVCVTCFAGIGASERFVFLFRLVGGLVSGFLALALALVAKNTVGVAPCPQCGAELAGLELKDEQKPEKCEKCGLTVVGKGGVIEAMRADHVAGEPVFEASLKAEKISWPGGCCVCEKPATRAVDVSVKDGQTGTNVAVAAAGLALGTLAIRRGGGTFYTVKVPHCGEHDNGAKLKLDSDQAVKVKLLFRSAAFHKKFVALNQVP
jgi:hypothetical protein